MHEPPRGPFCQSCGMPLSKAEDFGTAAEGFRINDYCHFCYQNGNFTEPNISRAAMIDKCVGILSRQGVMSEAQARHLMATVIPKLRRWRGVAA